MISCTFYDTSTGELKLGFQGERIDAMIDLYPQYQYVEGIYDQKTQYVLNGEVVDRPDMNIVLDKVEIQADGIDVLTITGAPANSVATFKVHDGERMKIVSGDILNPDTFKTQFAGTYYLSIESFPYKTWFGTFNAV